jgi:hypothetical protein
VFKQGVLPFRYKCEPTESGMTALAGLPAYLELAIVSGLTDSIQRHLGECARKEQGWTDTQIIMSLFLLNIAGGDSVDDLRILEKDNVAYVIICSSPVATFYNAQISYNMIINSFNVQ